VTITKDIHVPGLDDPQLLVTIKGEDGRHTEMDFPDSTVVYVVNCSSFFNSITW
jgi:hypothetical protein